MIVLRFNDVQRKKLEQICNSVGFEPWYGTGFGDKKERVFQATIINPKTRTTQVTFRGNISIEEDGTYKVRKLWGRDKEESFEDFDLAVKKLNEYLLERR
jgi:hypothetical protein